ncbi:MAG: hypothetical protein OXH84_06865 [Gammaproteobacteria bacterium]|nr:hypothetical protein [Gammaproteobacteria bacterium]
MIRKFYATLIVVLIAGNFTADEQLVLGTGSATSLEFDVFFEQEDGTFAGIGVSEEFSLLGGEYHNFHARDSIYLGTEFGIGEGTVLFCYEEGGCINSVLKTWQVAGNVGLNRGKFTPFISFNASKIDVAEYRGIDFNWIAGRGGVEWDVDLGLWVGERNTKFRFTLDRLLSENKVHRTFSVAAFFPVTAFFPAMIDYISGIEISYPISSEAKEESGRFALSIGLYF